MGSRCKFLGNNFLGRLILRPTRDIDMILRFRRWNDSQGSLLGVHSLNIGSSVQRGGTAISHRLTDLPKFFYRQSDVAGHGEVGVRIRNECIRPHRTIAATNPSSKEDEASQEFIIRDLGR